MTDTNYPMGDPHAVIRLAADPNYRVPNYMTADDPIPPRPDGRSPLETRSEDEREDGQAPLFVSRPARDEPEPVRPLLPGEPAELG